MYEVRTDHEIVALGTEEMVLIDSDGATIVRAVFADDQWVITAKSSDDNSYTAAERAAAVQAMTQLAYEVLGPNPNAHEGAGDGYSTMVPPSVVAMQ